MPDRQTIQYYDQNAAKYAKLTQSHSMRQAVQLVVDRLTAGASVLDLGCGAGRDLLEFRQRQVNAVGLDASSELAAIAAHFSGCPVVLADMEQMPFAEGSFGAVWASASLLHISRGNLAQALSDVRRVLKPGGLFFSSVKLGRGKERDRYGRYFSYFESNEWLGLLAAAGFCKTEVLPDDESMEEGGQQWVRALTYRA